MMQRCLTGGLLLMLLTLGHAQTARAEDQPTPPRTPTDVAAEVQAAFSAKDAEGLNALAAAPAPDPWLVADALCADAHFDAATAFAAATAGPDTKALSAYVVYAQGNASALAAVRARFEKARAARVAGDATRVAELLDLPEDGLASVAHLRCFLGRGSALTHLGQVAVADALIVKAADMAERIGWLRKAADIHYARGDYAERSGSLHQAIDAFATAAGLFRRIGDQPSAVRSETRHGLMHFYEGDYGRAREIFDALLAESVATKDRRLHAVCLCNIALVEHSSGDLRAAMTRYRKALKELEALGDGSGAASVLKLIGALHDDRGEYSRALSVYRRALDRFTKLGDAREAAATRGAIASVHHALGDYAKALAGYEGLVAEQRALGDQRTVAVSLSNLGGIYLELGDAERAMALLRESLAASKAMGDRSGVATALTNLGVVHEANGEFEEALAVHQEGLKVARGLGRRSAEALALGNVGAAYLRLERHDEALKLLRAALEILEEVGDRVTRAWIRQTIGMALAAAGKLPEAQAEFEWCTREARSLRATPLLVRSLSHLARVHLLAGDDGAALSTATRALESMEELLGGLGEHLGSRARAVHARVYGTGALAAAREDRTEDLLLFLESGRAGALLDTLGKREVLRWKAESLPQELRDADDAARATETAARRAYDQAAVGGKRREKRAALKALDAASQAVREVAGRIQRELKQQAGLFYPRAETLGTISEALAEDEALVLYGLCAGEALALVLEAEEARIVSLGTAEVVLDAAAALDATRLDVDAGPALAKLRALLVNPLQLKDATKRVLISPDGALCYLPFGAIFERTVTMTPSGTTHVLLRDEERTNGTGILAVGDPDYAGISEGAQKIYHRGRASVPLPATRVEVERIGTTTLLGAEASETGLREALKPGISWRAVHLACHGLVDSERPMMSSLSLSSSEADDGFLTATEVLRMRIATDLAVLSACETSKGRLVRGEGIVGLTRAFMFAGAGRVLCSLWKVDDEATQALMLKFYELWTPKEGEGLSAAAALQQAQAHVRAQPKWSHPYYWAAWVLWGLSD